MIEHLLDEALRQRRSTRLRATTWKDLERGLPRRVRRHGTVGYTDHTAPLRHCNEAVHSTAAC
jgi:hypothetical protein